MKVTNKQLIPGVFVAVAILSGGTYLTISNLNKPTTKVAYAYTSAANPQDPATAPDDYVVNFPDANLKAALNAIIDSSRPATQNITAGEMKNSPKLRVMASANSLNGKGISNIEGLQFLTNTTLLHMYNNSITDISPIKDLNKLVNLSVQNNQISSLPDKLEMPNLTVFDFSKNKISDLSPLALAGTPKLSVITASLNNISNIEPLAKIPTLTTLNVSANKLKSLDSFVNHPNIASLTADHNEIADLYFITKNAPATLKTLKVQSQNITVSTDTFVFANPLKTETNTRRTTPITNNAVVTMSSDDGTITANGDYLKILVSGKGSTETNFLINGGHPTITTSFVHSGKLRIDYNIDIIKPTFSPEKPAKIISRKGVAININDVTAQDNVGGSGISPYGVVNNANDINLNPDNPAVGKYNLGYVVKDNANNIATVIREIEITDADQLQAKVNSASDDMLNNGGYTDESVAQVITARKKATDIIANNSAPQSQIDQALGDLTAAINALTISTTPIDDQLKELDAKPKYIQDDPAVKSAKQQAERIKSDPARTKDQVEKAALGILNAIVDAEKKELDSQAESNKFLDKAEREIADLATDPNKLPAIDTDEIQSKIDNIQDPTKKAKAQSRLDTIKQAIENKKSQIAADKLAKAEQKAKEDLAKKNANKLIKSPNTGIIKTDSSLAVFGISLSAIALAILSFVFRKNNR